MDIIQIINIAAIILSPFFAVIVAQKLHDRAARRKDKIEIFKILFENSLPFIKAFKTGIRDKNADVAILDAITLIPIVFHKENRVLEAQEKFRSAHEALVKRIELNAFLDADIIDYLNIFSDLMLEIAKDLGYADFKPLKVGSPEDAS
ncbi:MAG: hypothetical protein FWC93_08395 [Defluviitaleaceae bacterium]|nr:hypothetical protein [Defluviitaleaceae bacterium]